MSLTLSDNSYIAVHLQINVRRRINNRNQNQNHSSFGIPSDPVVLSVESIRLTKIARFCHPLIDTTRLMQFHPPGWLGWINVIVVIRGKMPRPPSLNILLAYCTFQLATKLQNTNTREIWMISKTSFILVKNFGGELS